MTYRLSNCTVCKEIFKPTDEYLCNRHLMEMIREHRPTFITIDEKESYPEVIRANYDQDPVTKTWTNKSTVSEDNRPPSP